MACRVLLLSCFMTHLRTQTCTHTLTNARGVKMCELPQFDLILPCCDSPLHQTSFTCTFLILAFLSIWLIGPISSPQSCMLTLSWMRTMHTREETHIQQGKYRITILYYGTNIHRHRAEHIYTHKHYKYYKLFTWFAFYYGIWRQLCYQMRLSFSAPDC